MLRPGIVGMRSSMATRLHPCMIMSTPPLKRGTPSQGNPVIKVNPSALHSHVSSTSKQTFFIYMPGVHCYYLQWIIHVGGDFYTGESSLQNRLSRKYKDRLTVTWRPIGPYICAQSGWETCGASFHGGF